jgi:hypothetical protein
MTMKRLLCALLAPSLAIAVYGCADTDTPDVEYEANRPIYEDDTAVIEDPAAPDYTAPGATTEWDEDELDATDPTAPATDPTTQPPADPAQPDATGTTTPEGTSTPSEDVEEQPASDLPEEPASQSGTEGAQPE